MEGTEGKVGTEGKEGTAGKEGTFEDWVEEEEEGGLEFPKSGKSGTEESEVSFPFKLPSSSYSPYFI